MNQIDERIEALVSAVRESPDYIRYRQMLEKIRMEPEKEKAVNEFRKKTYLLQQNKANVDLFTEIDRLRRETAPLRAQPYVEEFLAAELALCRMVQHINYRLMEDIEFD